MVQSVNYFFIVIDYKAEKIVVIVSKKSEKYLKYNILSLIKLSYEL